MDTDLCDDLLREVFYRLPPSALPSVALVAKRWLDVLRSATSSLLVRVPDATTATDAGVVSLSTLLSRYPFLASLTVVDFRSEAYSADDILFLVSAAPCAARLTALFLAPVDPLSSAALLSCAPSFPRLASLRLSSLSHRRPSLRWLATLPSLKCLCLVFTAAAKDGKFDENDDDDDGDDRAKPPLPLERLSLTGLQAADLGFSWLWRRCGNLRWLKLCVCEGTGDGDSSEDGPFVRCLHDGLLRLELRKCHAITNRILLRAADCCHRLTSLLVNDGCSGDALSYFLRRRGAFLHALDLRLPLDLHNGHLLDIAGAEGGSYKRVDGHGNLVSLRLERSSLVTGDGLRTLMEAPAGAAIEELALVSCAVVEREPGLLLLGHSMRKLRKLDLSYNKIMKDEEFAAMLPSCINLVEIRLRGCMTLTGAVVVPLLKHCGSRIEVVDIFWCLGIGTRAIEALALNASRLKRLIVEKNKISEAAWTWLSERGVEVGID